MGLNVKSVDNISNLVVVAMGVSEQLPVALVEVHLLAWEDNLVAHLEELNSEELNPEEHNSAERNTVGRNLAEHNLAEHNLVEDYKVEALEHLMVEMETETVSNSVSYYLMETGSKISAVSTKGSVHKYKLYLCFFTKII